MISRERYHQLIRQIHHMYCEHRRLLEEGGGLGEIIDAGTIRSNLWFELEGEIFNDSMPVLEPTMPKEEEERIIRESDELIAKAHGTAPK